MGVQEWVDIETIKIIMRHSTGSVVALVVFALMDYGIKVFIIDETLKFILHTIDHWALIGMFAWLVYQMGCLCWNSRVKINIGPKFLLT